ncbi:MAG: diaminopimelate epimerase [Dehalococcoidia bacterium]|nr:diaminopimelate epimerase [Dehalococcoidia bacterium]
MKFAKMQGAGNDFVLVEAKGDERHWPHLALRMCDRHFGIGADGLVLVLPSAEADVGMRIFNADGSEAEMCGNAVRCLAKYAVERGLVRPKEGKLSVGTVAGILPVQVMGEGGKVERARVGMGAPRFRPEEVPTLIDAQPPLVNAPVEIDLGAAGSEAPLSMERLLDIARGPASAERSDRLIIPLTCLSMGNPHAVYFLPGPVAGYPLAEMGPRVERHPLFPSRTNFTVASVIDRGRMEARVWERGVGITLACGSGTCAAMVAARLQGLVDDVVDITLPGGTLRAEWDGAGQVFLSGPAAMVFEGEWPD